MAGISGADVDDADVFLALGENTRARRAGGGDIIPSGGITAPVGGGLRNAPFVAVPVLYALAEGFICTSGDSISTYNARFAGA